MSIRVEGANASEVERVTRSLAQDEAERAAQRAGVVPEPEQPAPNQLDVLKQALLRHKLVAIVVLVTVCLGVLLPVLNNAFNLWGNIKGHTDAQPSNPAGGLQDPIGACLDRRIDLSTAEQISESEYKFKRGESTIFARCTWPPRTAYTGDDGYSEVRLITTEGPGQTEASGENYARRITGPCSTIEATLIFGVQGDLDYLKPFETKLGKSVFKVERGAGKTVALTQRDPGRVYPYPGVDETVFLTNANIGVENIRCTA